MMHFFLSSSSLYVCLFIGCSPLLLSSISLAQHDDEGRLFPPFLHSLAFSPALSFSNCLSSFSSSLFVVVGFVEVEQLTSQPSLLLAHAHL